MKPMIGAGALSVGLAVLAFGCLPKSQDDESDDLEGAVSSDVDYEDDAIAYLYVTADGKDVSHCAATLIGPSALVTAASCLDPVAFDPAFAPTRKYEYSVFFGKDPNKLYKEETAMAQVVTGTYGNVKLPDEWSRLSAPARKGQSTDAAEKRARAASNVAVLTLDESKSLRPIELDPDETTSQEDEAAGKTASLVGFGGASPGQAVLAQRNLALQFFFGAAPDTTAWMRPVATLGAADVGGPLLVHRQDKDVLSGVYGGKTTVPDPAAPGKTVDVLTFVRPFKQKAFLDPFTRSR